MIDVVSQITLLFTPYKFSKIRLCLSPRTLYYGRLSPLCISTYYKYGLTLLYKARADIAPYQDLVKGDDTGISMASGSNVKEGDTGKGIRHYSFTSYNHIHCTICYIICIYVVD